MAKGALTRGGIAATASLALVAGLGPAIPHAYAETAAEVVIPAETSLLPRTVLLSAGPSGFLRHEPGRGHLWTTYTGADTVVDPSASEVREMPEFGAGSDTVARYDSGTRTVSLRDMAAGTTAVVPVPAGHTYQGTLGRTVVTTAWSGDWGWYLHDVGDGGTVHVRPVAGVPAGATPVSGVDAPHGDARGMLVQYRRDGALRAGWLDTGERRLTELPHTPVLSVSGRAVLTATHLLTWDGSTVTVYSREDLATPVRTVPLADDDRAQLLGMVGDTLLVSRHDPSLGAPDGPASLRIDGVAADGSTTGTLVARSHTSIALPTPDGGLLVPGSGSGADDWGVTLIEAGPDGAPVARRVAGAHPMSVTDPVYQLTLAQGRLTALEHDHSQARTFLYSRTLGVTGTPEVGPRTARGRMDDGECRTEKCVDFLDADDGRTVVTGTERPGSGVPRLLRAAEPLPGTPVEPLGTYDRVETGGRHAALLTRWTEAEEPVTKVVDLDTGGTVRTVPGQPEAMWGTTLWMRDGNDGVRPIDVRTGQWGDPVWFGRGCLLEDLQAVGRWLLWSCVGSAEGQGVYDTAAKTSLTLTKGPWEHAKLGDGFVATGENGLLKITDVRTGTAVTHTAGAFEAWKPWDVDPYTGLIAHTDSRNGIHVVPSGVPVPPLAQLDSAVAGTADVKGGAGLWSPRWWLSKPAASWKLAIRNKATGATVRTLSGGVARDVVPASWNGKDTAGRLVPNGAYTWTLTAVPADGQGASLTRTGTVKVTGAAAVRRDFTGSDGFGELVTLNGSGGLTYQYGTGTGTFSGKKTGSGWPTTVRAVPFGDLSGDRCNDVLVRFSNGTLRAYRPKCGEAVTPSTAYTAQGSSGWNQYDVLTSPGDVSGDGRADLVVRQASTGDVYLYRATSTGKFSAREKIHSGWTGYKKIVGAGDLNGDGHGDLLAQDKSNELWRFDGTATGRFKSRVKVFNDWGGSYNVVVGVGDITGDGRSDLVSRDTSGNVWRNSGNGKGSFGSRTRIATGWQGYKGLF